MLSVVICAVLKTQELSGHSSNYQDTHQKIVKSCQHLTCLVGDEL
ncbi:hypothetical protein GPLA_2387 [Paraglaciecola polaris LMG 21857]|uniref:Uncharacterized protein n=1 Tax=Paraglaciecola polaris LMG 21857 TaxID=1129793 RepID=K6ZSN9_9ALTE|nr:hypothetical protein GPLA_2387 [Paraglaciecola polaris LMG 21857]